jgi:hypothetical protein
MRQHPQTTERDARRRFAGTIDQPLIWGTRMNLQSRSPTKRPLTGTRGEFFRAIYPKWKDLEDAAA